jgi:hypothetical protein
LLWQQQRAADKVAEEALYNEKMALLNANAEKDQKAANQA